MDDALAEPYKHLRSQALQLTGAQAGITDPTFGVLMETGYPEAMVREVGLRIPFPDRCRSIALRTPCSAQARGRHPWRPVRRMRLTH
jgi:hypothetical protein